MPLSEIHVTPSILSADFSRLAEHVKEIMHEGCRVIHCDVMDGHFVPPITFGPMVVAALRESLPDEAYLDVHLMIERPERHIEEFAKAGADGITIHVEATPHLDFALSKIRDLGCKAGLTVCPGTPPEHFAQVGDLDLALIMTVNPGWGGQAFMPKQLDKIRRVREMLGPDVAIEVDGGVNPETGKECADAGATWFVAGSAIFNAPDPVAAYHEIAKAVGAE
jgi:ribulose-phosphate 3-epimerase